MICESLIFRRVSHIRPLPVWNHMVLRRCYALRLVSWRQGDPLTRRHDAHGRTRSEPRQLSAYSCSQMWHQRQVLCVRPSWKWGIQYIHMLVNRMYFCVDMERRDILEDLRRCLCLPNLCRERGFILESLWIELFTWRVTLLRMCFGRLAGLEGGTFSSNCGTGLGSLRIGEKRSLPWGPGLT